MILTNDEDMIDKAYVLLHDEMLRYRRGKFKKWIWLSVGLIFAVLVGVPTQEFAPMVFNAFYDKSGLKKVTMKELHRNPPVYFKDIAVDDLLIPAFEFNQNEPRFYSKWFAEYDPGIYDVELWEAVLSSSSAPIYFDPNTRTNGYGVSAVLIDGGIICNNPS